MYVSILSVNDGSWWPILVIPISRRLASAAKVCQETPKSIPAGAGGNGCKGRIHFDKENMEWRDHHHHHHHHHPSWCGLEKLSGMG